MMPKDGVNAQLRDDKKSAADSSPPKDKKSGSDIPDILAKKKHKAAIKIQVIFRKFLYRKKKNFKNVQWMTGSNGHYVLPSLIFTDFTLVPTGELIRSGIAPLGGELLAGVLADGFNQYSLSGARPERFSDAWGYATGYHYPIQQKLARMIDFIKASIAIIEKSEQPPLPPTSNDLAMLNLTILSLRQIDEQAYQSQFAVKINEIAKLVDNESYWREQIEAKRIAMVLERGPIAQFNFEKYADKRKNWETLTTEQRKQLRDEEYKELVEIRTKFEAANFRTPWFCDGHIMFDGFGYVKKAFDNFVFDCSSENYLRGRFYYSMDLPDMIVFAKSVDSKSLSEKRKLILDYVRTQLDMLEREKVKFNAIASQRAKMQLSAEDKKNMGEKAVFPLVFSTTKVIATHPHPVVTGEDLYKGSLKLGQDITGIITDPKHESQLRRYLRAHGLRKSTFVTTNDKIEHHKCQIIRGEIQLEKVPGKLNFEGHFTVIVKLNSEEVCDLFVSTFKWPKVRVWGFDFSCGITIKDGKIIYIHNYNGQHPTPKPDQVKKVLDLLQKEGCLDPKCVVRFPLQDSGHQPPKPRVGSGV